MGKARPEIGSLQQGQQGNPDRRDERRRRCDLLARQHLQARRNAQESA